ncbi:hypothetical protein [Alkalihalobacillus sp. 1P02AB]|uniref:hypothetical protein n=1 Tax=Alkalihalobacillus sp. 1P02AB TaxID=3132260 RepID=UPI0039A63D3A
MKNKMTKVLYILLAMLIGFIGGYLGSTFLTDTNLSLMNILLAIITLIISFVLHLIIHEFGHLIFGKLTGYKMLSFRIFSYIWVKEEGRLVFKRLSVPGTLGQCLMVPPAHTNGQMPFKFYLLGGGLLNLIFSGLLLGGAILFDFRSIHLLAFVMAGVITALLNLIPMAFNDGMTLKKAWNDQEVQRYIYKQLTVNALTTHGTRYQDLTNDLIEKPSKIDYYNMFHVWTFFVHYNRAVERFQFHAAKEIIDELWANIDPKSFYRVEIAKEWMFCQMYFAVNEAEVQTLYKEKSVQASLSPKMMNHFRVKAMYEWKIENNQDLATRLFEEGLSNIKKHANKADLLFETNLIKHCLAEMEQERQVERPFYSL